MSTLGKRGEKLREILDKINRKVALKLVEQPDLDTPVVIRQEDLVEYLGQPVFVEDEILKADKIGMALGGMDEHGRRHVDHRSAEHPGKGEVKLTGQLGT